MIDKILDYEIEESKKILDAQIVRISPTKEAYLRIEKEAYELFLNDKRFLLDNKKVDMALVSAVLWWKGANRGNLYQYNIFDKASTLPYSKIVKFNNK